MRPARKVFWKRAIPAVLVFAAVQVVVTRVWGWDLQFWIIERGKAAGCDVVQSSAYFIGEDGPFFGEGFRDAAWNFVWRHAALMSASGAGLACAALVYALGAGPLRRTRVFGYRGPTRCGACGYALAGLVEPRCPECGRAI